MEDKIKGWVWADIDETCIIGIFESKEEAMRLAKLSGQIKVWIGHAIIPSPENHMYISALDLVEESTCKIHDNILTSSEDIFSLKEGAQEALNSAIKKWAKNYIISIEDSWVYKRVEKVDLGEV